MEEYNKRLIETIKEEAKKGNEIYTVLRSVSRSGMMRKMDVYLFVDNKPIYLNGLIEDLGLYKRDKQTYALKVGGCGMDMGFSVVYNLSRAIFKEFVCFGETCHSNDHTNGDRNFKPHNHTDGGYALTQRWI